MSDSGKAYEWVDKQDQAALNASPRVLAAESYLAGITSRDAEVESLQADLAKARERLDASREYLRAFSGLTSNERVQIVERERDGARAVIERAANWLVSGQELEDRIGSALFELNNSAPSSALDAVKAELVSEIASAIRAHATAPHELIHPVVQIDALIAWVADWIENPPDWVHVSYRSGS